MSLPPANLRGARVFPAGSGRPGCGEESRMLQFTATPEEEGEERLGTLPSSPKPASWGPAGPLVYTRRPGGGGPIPASSKCNCVWTLKRNCVKWAAALKSTALFGMEICFCQN